MKMYRSARSTTALLAVMLLAACSRDEPERPVANDTQADTELSATPAPTPDAESTPRIPAPDAAIQSNAIGELSDGPVVDDETAAAPDQQMLDDASASGMTARATRDTGQADETPAEVVEQK